MGSESWYYINKSTGKIMYHWEPDGWSYLKAVQKGESFDADKEVAPESLDVWELVRIIKELKPEADVPSSPPREELLRMVESILRRYGNV
jgi:hypothetical protein